MSVLADVRALDWFDDVRVAIRDGPTVRGYVWKCQHRTGSPTSDAPGSVFLELQVARDDLDVGPLATARVFCRGTYRRAARLDLTAYVRRVDPGAEPGTRAPRHELGSVRSVDVVEQAEASGVLT